MGFWAGCRLARLPAKFVAPSGISPDTKWVSKDTSRPAGHRGSLGSAIYIAMGL